MPAITYTEFTNIIKQDTYDNKYVSLNEDGNLYIWQYGDTAPTLFATDVADFQSNNRNIIIFKNDGTIFGRGYNENGILGLGHANSATSNFYEIKYPVVAHVLRYELDNYNFFVYDKDDNVWGVGYNNPDVKLWNDLQTDTVLNWTYVGKYAEISCGEEHIVVQTSDGRILVKGKNTNGALGLHKGPTYVAHEFEYTGMLTASSSKTTAKYSIDVFDLTKTDKLEMQYGPSLTPSETTIVSESFNEDFLNLAQWDTTNAGGKYFAVNNALTINNSNIADSNYYITTASLCSLPFRTKMLIDIKSGVENSKFILDFLSSDETFKTSIDLTLDQNELGINSSIFGKYIYSGIPSGEIFIDMYITKTKQYVWIYNSNGILLFNITSSINMPDSIKLKLKIIAADDSKVYYMVSNKLLYNQEFKNLRFDKDFAYKVQRDENQNIKIDWKTFNLNECNFKVIDAITMQEADYNVDRKKEAIKIIPITNSEYYYLKLDVPVEKVHTDISEEVTETTPSTVLIKEVPIVSPYGENDYKIKSYVENEHFDRPLIFEYDATLRTLAVKQWRYPGRVVDIANFEDIGVNDKIVIGSPENTIEQFWLEYFKPSKYIKLPLRAQEYVPLKVKRIKEGSNKTSNIFIDFD